MAKERKCKECGAVMNHHADKVDYTAAPERRAPVDPVFGGVLLEAYGCPACGRSEAFPAGS